jgi:hypothetical protein
MILRASFLYFIAFLGFSQASFAMDPPVDEKNEQKNKDDRGGEIDKIINDFAKIEIPRELVVWRVGVAIGQYIVRGQPANLKKLLKGIKEYIDLKIVLNQDSNRYPFAYRVLMRPAEGVKDTLALLEILFKYGAKPNYQRNKLGHTAVHVAVIYKQPQEVFELLAKNKAKFTKLDSEGKAPLARAKDPEMRAIVEKFLPSKPWHR